MAINFIIVTLYSPFKDLSISLRQWPRHEFERRLRPQNIAAENVNGTGMAHAQTTLSRKVAGLPTANRASKTDRFVSTPPAAEAGQ
jgi:hypothetical protein